MKNPKNSSFFLAFITVAVVCVMDLVVWNKRGLDWIGFTSQSSSVVRMLAFMAASYKV